MDKTAISTKPMPGGSAVAAAPSAPPPKKAPKPLTFGRIVYKFLLALASLKLTVWLFALAIPLVFFGTLAQVDAGIWTVVNRYFRSLAVFVPFQIFINPISRTVEVPGGFPYPGGWLLGALLLINVLAAHAVRFKLTWKRSGIFLIHAGVIIIMISELVTGLFATESHMTIELHKSSDFIERTGVMELAILKKIDGKNDQVIVIPERLLKSKGLISHEELPFDVDVLEYMVNSEIPFMAEPGTKENRATEGIGRRYMTKARREGSGVDPQQKQDMPSAYVRLKKKGSGEDMGTYMVSLWVPANGAKRNNPVDGGFELVLRSQRTYKAFHMHLVDFKHERYPGTDKPKDFTSRIRLVDPENREDREVVISMNAPFTYRGETYYQASVLQGDSGTVLQVVRNPGWSLPYVAFFMVGIGLLIHFILHLVVFVVRRLAL